LRSALCRRRAHTEFSSCALFCPQILDVKRDSTQQQIQKSYRKLSLLYHPDKHPGDEKAAKKFEDVKTAYEVLSDPEKRQSASAAAQHSLAAF
jgi:molecular chaperone DnaJ